MIIYNLKSFQIELYYTHVQEIRAITFFGSFAVSGEFKGLIKVDYSLYVIRFLKFVRILAKWRDHKWFSIRNRSIYMISYVPAIMEFPIQ